MPLYRTSLRLAWDVVGVPQRRWSNTFFLNQSSSLAAASQMVALWDQVLRGAARQRVYAYEAYAVDTNEATDDYAVLPVPVGVQRGTLAGDAGNEAYLPKACMAVTLTVLGSRPSRKFWRPALYEPDVLGGVTLSPTLITAVRTAFEDLIEAAGGSLVDPDGQSIAAVTKLTLTTREFGRESTADVPVPPALG